jgi:hypothetical protein
MSLKNMTLKDDGCTIAVTGGETITFGEDATVVANGIHLIDVNQADFRDRLQLTVKAKPPVLDTKTGELSKEGRSFVFARPHCNTDNSVSFESARVDMQTLPGTGASMLFRMLIAQFLVSSDADAYFTTGVMN